MIASLSEFDSPRLSLHSGNESKKRSMIKELREDYRKCFANSALSSTAKRFSPTTLQFHLTGFVWKITFNYKVSVAYRVSAASVPEVVGWEAASPRTLG
jgi:hypothetical protein